MTGMLRLFHIDVNKKGAIDERIENAGHLWGDVWKKPQMLTQGD
jgi:hypothetical protein